MLVYHVCGPVCLFVYKCICMSVLLCVYKYIFCTECTKGLGLAKSTIRPALYLCLTKTHPTSGSRLILTCHLIRFVAWATTLHVMGCTFTRFHNEAFLLQKTGKTDHLLHLQMKALAPLVSPSTFLTGHVSGFQNSTLCKAPVCVCVSISPR